MRSPASAPRNRVRETALGGLLAALSALLFGMLTFVDFSGLFVYLASTPVIAGGVLFGASFALQVAAASTLLVSLWLSPFPAGVHYLITQLPLGVCLGYCYARALPHRRILLAAVMTLTVSQGVLFLVDLHLLGINPENFLAFAAPLMHVKEEVLLQWSLLLYPAFIFLYSLCFAAYIWFFNTVILRRLRLIEQEAHPFVEIPALMDVSPVALSLVVPGALLLLVARLFPGKALIFLGTNILAVFVIFCYVKGFYLFNRALRFMRVLSRPWRLLMVTASFLFSVTVGLLLLPVAGLFALGREALASRVKGGEAAPPVLKREGAAKAPPGSRAPGVRR